MAIYHVMDSRLFGATIVHDRKPFPYLQTYTIANTAELDEIPSYFVIIAQSV